MRFRSWISAARKHFMLAAAIALATPGQFVVPTPAVAGPPPNTLGSWVQAECQQAIAFGEISSNQLGLCVGTTATGFLDGVYGRAAGGQAAEVCNYWLNVFPDFFHSEWDSYTACLADSGVPPV